MNRAVLFLFLFLLLPFSSFSGNADSLENLLKKSTNNYERMRLSQHLCEEYTARAEFEKAYRYGIQALDLSVKEHRAKSMAYSYYILGNVLYYKNDLKGSVPYYQKCLDIRVLVLAADTSDVVNKKELANAHNDIGFVYDYLSNYPLALSHFLSCLKIAEEIGDKELIAVSCMNIGNVHEYQNDLEESLEFKLKALKVNKEIGRKGGIALSYNNIGNIFYLQKKLGEAIYYQKKSLEIKREVGAKLELASSLSNMANIIVTANEFPADSIYRWLPEMKKLPEPMLHKKILDTADAMLNEALQYCIEVKSEYGMMQVYKSLGTVANMRNNEKSAMYFLSRAVELGDKLGAQKELHECYKTMADITGRNGDFSKAYKFQKLFSELRDTIYNENKEKDLGKQEAQFEYDKELFTRQKEQEKQNAIHDEEKRRQKLTIVGVSAGLLLMLVFAVFILRSYRQKQKANILLSEKNEMIEMQKLLVEEKNKDILDSIHYAKRIQRSLLTTEKYIDKSLKRLKKY